jgi:hypothetical protein
MIHYKRRVATSTVSDPEITTYYEQERERERLILR